MSGRTSRTAMYWSGLCLASVALAAAELLLPFQPNDVADNPAGLDTLPAFLLIVGLLWLHGLAMPRARLGPIGWTWVCLTVLQLALGAMHTLNPREVSFESNLNTTGYSMGLTVGAIWLLGLPVSIAVAIFRARQVWRAQLAAVRRSDWRGTILWTSICAGSLVAAVAVLSLPFEPRDIWDRRPGEGTLDWFGVLVFLVWIHGLALPRARVGPVGWILIGLTAVQLLDSVVHSDDELPYLEPLLLAWLLVGLPLSFLGLNRGSSAPPPAAHPTPPD